MKFRPLYATVAVFASLTFATSIAIANARGGGGVIDADEVDWDTTTRANSARGIRVTLRSGRSNPAEPGL